MTTRTVNSMASGSATKAKIPTRKAKVSQTVVEFSPSWVVFQANNAPGIKLELIERIRTGVKKEDWKQLIEDLGTTEKEFENILPTSISSMQKKKVYDKETSERIYEISRLFGLGFEVFDSREDFKSWLLTPSKAL